MGDLGERRKQKNLLAIHAYRTMGAMDFYFYLYFANPFNDPVGSHSLAIFLLRLILSQEPEPSMGDSLEVEMTSTDKTTTFRPISVSFLSILAFKKSAF